MRDADTTTRNQNCITKTLNQIRACSVGKYNHGLYLNGTAYHSSVFGGILTILSGIGLIIYAIIVFQSIQRREEYRTESNIVKLKGTNFEEVTVEQFLSKTMKISLFQVFLDKSYGYRSCDDLSLKFEFLDDIPIFSPNLKPTKSSIKTAAIECIYEVSLLQDLKNFLEPF